MNIIPTGSPREVSTPPSEVKKSESTISNTDLTVLAKEGKLSKITNQDVDTTRAFVKPESKSSSKSIKKSFTSFFDTSLHDDKKVDVKTKGSVKEKLKHEKEIKAFIKKYKPEPMREYKGGPLINDPAYIAKSMDSMLSHIDDASKCSTKAEKQECLNKLIQIKNSDEFLDSLGHATLENMITEVATYKEKVLGKSVAMTK